jgi:hypothetical protein
MAAERFQIRIDPLWQPLLLAGGATPATAYVELRDDTIEIQFGWWFKETLRRADVTEAVIRQWPVWMGVGWRTNFLGQVGLIGSYRGVVELRLRTPIRVWQALPCRRLAISLEEPGRFLEALAEGYVGPLGF